MAEQVEQRPRAAGERRPGRPRQRLAAADRRQPARARPRTGSISRMPSQNTGIDTPSWANIMQPTSTVEPWRIARGDAEHRLRARPRSPPREPRSPWSPAAAPRSGSATPSLRNIERPRSPAASRWKKRSSWTATAGRGPAWRAAAPPPPASRRRRAARAPGRPGITCMQREHDRPRCRCSIGTKKARRRRCRRAWLRLRLHRGDARIGGGGGRTVRRRDPASAIFAARLRR